MLKKIETNITKEINNDTGLAYCKLCVINNKRPVTSLESKNFIGSQKKLHALQMEFVMLVDGQKKKIA